MQQLTGLLLLGVLISLFTLNQAPNQKAMETQIKQTVERFAEAGAQRDLQTLEAVLHPEYRVLANRFADNPGLTILSRAQYLSMMEAEQIGGNAVTVVFDQVMIHAHSASVQASFNSDQTAMKLFLLLIQTAEGQWQITSDMAVVLPR